MPSGRVEFGCHKVAQPEVYGLNSDLKIREYLKELTYQIYKFILLWGKISSG